MINKKNILITGATGIIGSELKQYLESKNYSVLGLSRNRKSDITLDLRHTSQKEISSLIIKYKINTIIHCAADKQTQDIDAFILNSFAINNFFINKDCQKIKYIVIGSSSEYGDTIPKKLSENTPCIPFNNYGTSKFLQTTLCHYYQNKGLNITVLRLFNIITPKLPPSTIVGALISGSKKKSDHIVTLNKTQIKRDFVDIRDFSSLIEKLINSPQKDLIYNVASGKPVTYQKLGEIFNKILKNNHLSLTTFKVLNHPERLNKYCADIQKIKIDYNWKPKYSLEESIKWCLKKNKIIQ